MALYLCNYDHLYGCKVFFEIQFMSASSSVLFIPPDIQNIILYCTIQAQACLIYIHYGNANLLSLGNAYMLMYNSALHMHSLNLHMGYIPLRR